jgi:hypothetical protein
MLNFQQDYLHRYIFNESYYYNHKYLQVDIYCDELCTIIKIKCLWLRLWALLRFIGPFMASPIPGPMYRLNPSLIGPVGVIYYYSIVLHRYIFNESYYYNHKYLQVDIYCDELCTIN